METGSDATSATSTTSTSDQLLPQRSAESVLLFSLQFFLKSIELRVPELPSKKKGVQASESGGFLIGFQLLQYEIVLFDAVASDVNSEHTVSDGGKEVAEVESGDGIHREEETQRPRRVVLKPQHGKSCLFEADAEDLAVDLQRELDAPLALLVMQQDHGKARLVAFASVPVELHVGLLSTSHTSSKSGMSENAVPLDKEMRFRVCEWASSSGRWEMRDYQNRVVGAATGAATLSCLGRTLAPHIVNAIGLQVGKAVLPSSQPRRSLQGSPSSPHAASGNPDGDERESGKLHKVGFQRDKTESSIEFTSADIGVGLKAEKAVIPAAQKTDMAVQCEEDLLTTEEAALISHSVPRAVSRGNCQVYPVIHIESQKKHTKSHSGAQRLRSSPVNSHSPRSFPDRDHHIASAALRKGTNHHSRLEKCVFARDLPPPLFFQKPKQQKKK